MTPKLMYCIDCGKVVDLISDDYHLKLSKTTDEYLYDICLGPFTFDPPPAFDFEEGWQDRLSPPSIDERFINNIDFVIERDEIVILEM